MTLAVVVDHQADAETLMGVLLHLRHVGGNPIREQGVKPRLPPPPPRGKRDRAANRPALFDELATALFHSGHGGLRLASELYLPIILCASRRGRSS
jgi:hypothetical protein